MDSTALQIEAAFADSEYTPHRKNLGISQRMFQKYANPEHRWDWREFSAELMGSLDGKYLLDYGCGMGEEATYFAKLGANVTAIDASEVGVEITRERAGTNGLGQRVTAMVMDATDTDFPDDSFDLVHGLGILHHIGLSAGLSEVKRVLKPGGSAVFLEPMGNVRFIEKCKGWLHRRLVNKLDLIKVNEQEENLKLCEIRGAVSQFAYARVYPYRLFYRIRRLCFPRFLHPTVERFDYELLKMAPFLHLFAGGAVIHVRK